MQESRKENPRLEEIGTIPSKSNSLKLAWEARYLYILLMPLIVYYVVFHYYPMYGIIIAFKEYSFSKGILGSSWVGFEHFEMMFQLPQFFEVLRNTLIISVGRIVIEFPVPILFALLLNEVRKAYAKRFTRCRRSRVIRTIFISPKYSKRQRAKPLRNIGRNKATPQVYMPAAVVMEESGVICYNIIVNLIAF